METFDSYNMSYKRKQMDLRNERNICHDSSKFCCNESTKKQNHSEIEKRRRDKMNRYILELSSLVPVCKTMSRKVDKLTVLRMAVQQIRALRNSVNPYIGGVDKPSFLSDKELKSLLFQAVKGFILVVSCDRGRILFVSESVSDILNYTQSDLIGQSWFDTLHPKDITKIKEQLSSEFPLKQRSTDFKIRQPIKNEILQNHPRLYPGTIRSFYCRMKHKEPLKLCDNVYKKQKLQSYDQCYCTIRCTGYLKLWNSLASTVREKECGNECDLNCLVLVGQVNQLETGLVRSGCDLSPLEFCVRLSVEGKFLLLDQPATLLLGYVSQELLGSSYYEFLHQSDIDSVSEFHRQALQSKMSLISPMHRFRTKDGLFAHLQSKWKSFYNPWTKKLEYIICRSTLIQTTNVNDEICYKFNQSNSSLTHPSSSETLYNLHQKCDIDKTNIGRNIALEFQKSRTFSNNDCNAFDFQEHPESALVVKTPNNTEPSRVNSSNLWQPCDKNGTDESLEQQILIESYQNSNTECNDEAAMASIMSLLEADAGLGGPVDFNGLPWPLL